MAKVQKVETTSSTHSFSDEEKEAFVDHINSTLGKDPHLADKLPLNPSNDSLFEACTDGILLCKLINSAVPDTIDVRVLNVKKGLNVFEKTENNNLAINSAKAIGCSVVNIGSQDVIEARPHLLLGMIWQIIRAGLLANINLQQHPELFRLLEPGEELSDLMKLPPDQLLLRWMNYHLAKAGYPKKVTNFSGDIKDSEAYTYLLNQIAPDQCSKGPLNEKDLTKRAGLMLDNADKLGCKKFVRPRDVVKGNPKLNMAFVANLFNTHPGLEPLSQKEKDDLDAWLFNAEGTREARAFMLWINSLGVEPYVTNLFEDLRDGLILLKVMDKVSPGIVDWSKVNKEGNLNKFKKVENCNYAVVIGKQLKFSLVGIGGNDIVDGNKNLTLAIVWQLMRLHVVSIIKSLSKGGKDITEDDMVKWANSTVQGSGKTSKMDSFKDSSLKTGVFFIDLLGAIRPGCVNYDIVTRGSTDEEATQNAKYAISMARKLGACIFCLPEDLVEVKPKMILTFVGAIMASALEQK